MIHAPTKDKPFHKTFTVRMLGNVVGGKPVKYLNLTMDVHAPSKLRANIQLQNIDDFFTTFGIEEGDGMYRAPEDRVSIW